MPNREQKEKILHQYGTVIWFTGLPRSGKTTLAEALSEALTEKGFFCHVLDGDKVRQGINSDLGYSLADREENIRRVAEICRILTDNGIITLCSFVSPTEKIRNRAKKIIGEKDFMEIYVSTALETCEERDKYGLYKKSRTGEIKDFTGISSPFEVPVDPDFIVDSGKNTVEDCINEIMVGVLPHIRRSDPTGI
jgi:adenylylsulfate kinase